MADSRRAPQALISPVPTIVFHGDRDIVVGAHNGDMVIAQSMAGLADSARDADSYGADYKQVERGAVAGGYSYTRTMLQDLEGRILGEQWLVHGAGHAGSRGDPSVRTPTQRVRMRRPKCCAFSLHERSTAADITAVAGHRSCEVV
jgi:poly(3-hydroxybutyrate) depolymerase